MTETPVLFGPRSELLGVLTQPAQHEGAVVAFLMFNAGVISRIGPHRMNVKLARALADAGQTCLRFDLSGHGDSRSAAAEGDLLAQAVHDLRCAMDHLEHTVRVRRFALIGFCSGAVNALAAAVADHRVAGVLMFDGNWYHTRWTVPLRNWKRFRASSWSQVAAAVWRRVSRLTAGTQVRANATPFDANAVWRNPPREEFARFVQTLVDRHVAIFFIYSGSVIDHYAYANQFRDAFAGEAFIDKVRCDYYPDIDHTLISLDVQHRLIEIISAWVPDVHRACAAPL